jgi:Protein of unknown function (DUF742)
MSQPGQEPRLVPVYALTDGRTRSHTGDLPMETMITTTKVGLAALPRLQFEQAHIVDLCQWPMSVAEVAAELSVPVGVAQVLVADLSAMGLLEIHLPHVNDQGRPAVEVLERLLIGLKRGA